MSSVFVSYSRRDRDAVAAMVSALRAAGDEVWVDLDDIVPSAVWMEEIKTAIANADSVMFVVSPDSVSSEVCGIELKYAVDLSKRIVPVVIRETAVEVVPAPLPDINWIFVKPETFDADVARLGDVLETDIERVHLHPRLLVRATQWETRGGDKSLLLRGAQLAEAERWLARSLAAQLVADFRALSDEELPARAIYDMLFLTVDQRVRDSD
jgi:TIR domain